MSEDPEFASDISSLVDATGYKDARSARIVLVLCVLLVAGALLCIFLPGPEIAAIGPMVVFPWLVLGIVVAGKHQFTLIGGGGKVRHDLGLMAILPGFVLVVRLLVNQPEFVGFAKLVPVALAAGVGLTSVALIASGAARRIDARAFAQGALMLVAFSLYTGTSALLLSREFVQGEPEVYRAMVSSKDIQDRGSWGHAYLFRLTELGPYPGSSDMSVGVDLFHRMQPGEYVCVDIHPGFFKVGWIDPRPCPKPARTAQQIAASVATVAPAGREAAQPAVALAGPDVIHSRPEPSGPGLGDLFAGRFEKLDAYFNNVQTRYEGGVIGEQALLDSFRAMYDNSGNHDALYERWIDASPNSYAARLLYGAHLYDVGRQARGTDYARNVSRESMTRMRDYFARARPVLVASVGLTAKPYLTDLIMLNLTQISGTADERRQWLDAGIEIDPANFLVRRRYMETLAPNWYGSFEQMEAFRDASANSGAPPDVVSRLDALILDARGDDAQTRGEYDEARAFWSRVLDIYAAQNLEPPYSALQGYAQSSLKMNRQVDAVPSLEKMAKRDPGAAWVHAQLGDFYTKNARVAEAWEQVQLGAKLNDPWSELAMGVTLYQGCPEIHLAADRAAGREWAQKAAVQGDHEATEFLRSHP